MRLFQVLGLLSIVLVASSSSSFAPPAPVNGWHVGDIGETCSAVCAAASKTCNAEVHKTVMEIEDYTKLHALFFPGTLADPQFCSYPAPENPAFIPGFPPRGVQYDGSESTCTAVPNSAVARICCCEAACSLDPPPPTTTSPSTSTTTTTTTTTEATTTITTTTTTQGGTWVCVLVCSRFIWILIVCPYRSRALRARAVIKPAPRPVLDPAT